MIDRRLFLASGLAAAACGAPGAGPAADPSGAAVRARRRLEAIRARLGPGARLGVAAIETGSGRALRFDADSPYALASTFKLPLAGAVLALAERGRVALAEEIAFGAGDPLDNSPVVAANLRTGRLPVLRLCEAIIEQSDNSAANLLLRRIGGPAALTRILRAWGDPVTRLDRFEMALNANLPGDPRDTTTPSAMAALARRLVLGDLLRADSRRLLGDWLKRSVPWPDRLRAGLPAGWSVGHKPGTGANGAVNDVALAWPPGAAPIVIACYQSGGTAPMAVRAVAHADVARVVAELFG
jgi:beta-lactamase class A